MLFVDASVLLASEDCDDANHLAARELLRGVESLETLDLAYYEVVNVAIRSWRDPAAAVRLRQRIAAIADDGGVVRVDDNLVREAAALAELHGISVCDASYAAAARTSDATLVSCDVRDLVSRGLAQLPSDVLERSGQGDDG